MVWKLNKERDRFLDWNIVFAIRKDSLLPQRRSAEEDVSFKSWIIKEWLNGGSPVLVVMGGSHVLEVVSSNPGTIN